MRLKNVLLIWVSLTIIYSIFGEDGVSFWDSFFFAKDYIFPVFLLVSLKSCVITTQEKSLCTIGISVYFLKFISEIGYILGLINLTSDFETVIYVVIILIILIIVGYDRKK